MYDIITIGTATRDIFLRSSAFKHVRDPEHLKKIGFRKGEAECFALGAKIELDELYTTFGGGAVNTAISFARQGLRTTIVAKVGDDDIGKRVVANIRSEHITPLMVKDKKNKTAYSTILLLPGGERTILVYRGAADMLREQDIPFSKLKSKWAYVTPGRMPLSLMMHIVSSLKRAGTRIAINPSGFYLGMGIKKLKALFKYVDVVLMNQEEASVLTGISYTKKRELFRKLDTLVRGIAVMTQGSQGALVSDGRYMYRAGTYKEQKLVDRTGAGDAFGSGFITGLIKKDDITYALKLASANAASVVEHVGAHTGAITEKEFNGRRFKYLDLDIEPLL